jgi:hypothetical protein
MQKLLAEVSMKNSDLFPLLNLPRLKIIAQDWAQRYPAIESLTLYCGRGRSTLAAYVVVAKATTTEDLQDPTDCEFEPSKDAAEQFPKYAQKKLFLKDWSYPLGGQLLEDLTSPSVYKDATTLIKWDDWLFRIIEKEEDLSYLEDDIIPDSALHLYERKKKKPRPSNIHKEQVQKVAKDLWRKDPTMTCGDIYNHREMKELLKSFNRRKTYVEGTITNWFKELNPDRSGGRPPKKSPAVKNKPKITLRKIDPNK